MRTFGAALRAARIESGVTVRELAELLGCSTQRVYQLQLSTGAHLSTARRVAEALGVEVADLIGGGGA
jgi:transcriptional regulator with XRE-family HTH domain